MNYDDQQDRIMDLLLAESLGGDAPPDLTARILEKAFPKADKPPLPWPLLRRAAMAVAAMIVVTTGLWTYFHFAYPPPAATGDYTVAGGGPVERGAVVTSGAGNAQLTLGGYSHLELSPGTRLKIEGSPQAEAVELYEGQLSADVAGPDGFAVMTPVATVRSSAARFRASLVDDETSPVPVVVEGEKTMAPKKLIVAALSGIVFVTGPAGETSVSAGQQKVFAASAVTSTAPGYTRIAGTISQLSNDRVTIQTTAGVSSLAITSATTAKINGNAASFSDLKVGMSVIAYSTDGKTAVTVIASVPTPPAPVSTNVAGTLAQIGADQLTIQSSTKTTVITLTPTTVIKLNGTVTTLSALKTGLSILALTTDGKTATEIRAYTPTPPAPPAPPAPITVGGTVSALGAGQVTIVDGTKSTVVTFTDATTFTINGVASNAAGLKTGMHIYATTTDGKTAADIKAYTPTTPTPPTPTPPAPINVTGTLTAITPTQLTLQTSTKTSLITITSATVIKLNGTVTSLTALKPGLNIMAITTDGKTATEIRAYTPTTPTPAPPPATTVGGTLSAIGAGQVSITDGTKTTIVLFTDSTTFNIGGIASTAAGLKTGMHIYATLGTDGKTATIIRAYTPTTQPAPTPAPTTINITGTLTAISSTQLTMKAISVTLTNSTVIKLNGNPAGVSALKVGMSIIAITTDGKTATEIRAYTTTSTQGAQ